jgi:protein-tyrosine phosphatase
MNDQDKPLSVLMVCLGNICRSPLAEAALRQAAARAGMNVRVDSAGTGDWHVGRPPDHRAQAVAKRLGGIDIGDLRARQFTADDFYRFDHILAMDEANLADLRAVLPANATAKLSLLLDHMPESAGKSVADPYYGDEAGFDITWREVSKASDAFLNSLS